MVMMIILIAERIVESMCAVLCMIAFYFQLPAKSLRTYLLSEATSSRCCVDTRHEVLVEACSRFGGSRMHHMRRNLRVPMCLHVWNRSLNGQPAFRNDTYALYHLMCLNGSLMCLWRDLFSFSLLYVLMMTSPECPTFSLSGMCCFSVCVCVSLPHWSFSTRSSVRSAWWRCTPERLASYYRNSHSCAWLPWPNRWKWFPHQVSSHSVCQYQTWLKVES